MEYRKLPKGNEQISVIGFGGSGLHQAGEKEAVETINLALENGINYFDLAVSFCWGQALDVSMPFHLASLILQSQTKCLTILYFLSFYTFDTLCFGWHFCNTFVISPNVFICFLY